MQLCGQEESYPGEAARFEEGAKLGWPEKSLGRENGRKNNSMNALS